MKRCSHELFRWSLMHSVRVPPIQRMADSVSGWFVPLVILIAVVAFLDLVCLGARARDGARSHCGCVGPDYCLSLRAGTGHADVDNGGGGQRRPRPGC
uniref:Lead, cadmium, zinc and mercury transporting ATPase n=1 Tax=Klebsiella pneumoniae TaxID=573 RepID=A0A8B0SPW8_KLEPN|nr:Lead, cadmium, zinc and mercury transporting ATPase [Klebsiella pneumoniae]